MRFGPHQRLTGIEFWPDGSWSQVGVIWPEDVWSAPRVPADDSSER